MKLDKSNIIGARFNGKDVYGIVFENYKMYPPENFRLVYTSLRPTAQPVEFNSDFTYSEETVFNDDNTITVTIKSNEYPTSMKFEHSGKTYDTSYLIKIDELFGTEKLTDAYKMYDSQLNLSDMPIDDLDFSSLTDMSYMFHNCQRIKNISTRNWRISNVESMNSLFNSCYNLQSLDLTRWNTSNVVSMYCMFKNCRSLTELELLNFRTNNVINMSEMFLGCRKLKRLNLMNFRTNNVSDFSYMFSEVEDQSQMGSAYRGLEFLNICNFNIPYDADVTCMFGNTTPETLRLDYCNNYTLQRILVDSGFGRKYGLPTNDSFYSYPMKNYMTKVYCQRSSLEDIVGPTGVVFYFSDVSEYYLPSYVEVNLLTLREARYVNPTYFVVYKGNTDCSRLARTTRPDYIEDEDGWLVANTGEIEATEFEYIHLWDTSNVTNMNSMFEDAVNVEHLNVSSFDTTKVSDMSGMFMNCTKLKELDLSNFTTNNVTNIRYMFYNCQSLESLNLSGWDLTTVISLLSAYKYEKILYGCPKLASLYLNKCNYETVKHILSLIRGINSQYKHSTTERCGNGNSVAYCDEALKSQLSTFVLPDGWTIEYN